MVEKKKQILFKQATFVTSALKLEECPTNKDFLPEIAVVGRSNVGKSSLLNHLLATKKLAKISSTPGKTQRINFFLIDESLFLVDLPGYGYAKTAKSIQKDWGNHLDIYLNKRKTLTAILFLLDIRHLPSKEDLAFFEWALFKEIPLIFILTKSDKLSLPLKKKNKEKICKILDKEKSLDRFPFIYYSIKEGKCKQNLIQKINEITWD